MATILVIDDQPAVREFVEVTLTGAGHTVRLAADGRMGLDIFKQSLPDLVITDIIMPNKDGVETIRALRDHDATVPIIAMSGGGRAQVFDFLDIARKYGAALAMKKPFKSGELLAAVSKILAGARASS